ncbi:hypothetical protein H6F76_26275 [Leptolyngbya sp. FACHB-321]|uniref:hypothetical protein n=1 Tax=Leptolyngbya sp. FACHB-321 TaxID=2692807 RepID=UPI0016899C94|nr:hypothetical protein [Leptolyngbya sp. FACHB-321]MBD2038464.1 hypothetical protein [Leptolyngbya sp. FACHB-321]
MSVQTPSKETSSKTKTQETTRLLLALWELGADKTALPKGKLPDRAKKAAPFKQLVEDGAIKVEKQKSSSLVSLEAKGVEQLAEELKTVDFKLDGTTTGAWLVRGLLKWLQQMETVTTIASTNGKAKKDTIASYDEFKTVALEVYDRLNREYNLDNLVPIYRIRREIGGRVSRSEFNEWVLEMQANDILQLQGGSVEDSSSDKVEDSITSKVSGLRFYAKRLA